MGEETKLNHFAALARAEKSCRPWLASSDEVEIPILRCVRNFFDADAS